MTERTLTGLRVERGLKLEELVELHLDDKAVELLKSDRINNRRRGEMKSTVSGFFRPLASALLCKLTG